MRKAFNSAYEAIYAFRQGNYEAYSSNIKCYVHGKEGLPTCFSYGTHYPLVIKDSFIGENCYTYLINIDGYSVTTSKHINNALNIFRNCQTIKINAFFYDRDAFQQVIHNCLNLWKDAKKCRKEHTREWKEKEAFCLFSRYANFARLQSRNIKLNYQAINGSMEEKRAFFDGLLEAEKKISLKKEKENAIKYAQEIARKAQEDKKKILIGIKKKFLINCLFQDNNKHMVEIDGVELSQSIIPYTFFVHYKYNVLENTYDTKSLVCSETSTGLSIRTEEKYTFKQFENYCRDLIFRCVDTITDAIQKELNKRKV